MASKQAARSTMNVMCTVDESHRDRLASVARKLESAGMKVAETLDLSGIIIGEVAHADLAKVHAVEGIEAVEEEPNFHVDR